MSAELFLIDLAGYGSAPDPKSNVPIQLHSQALGTFVQRVSIENPVLIGHSLGTQVGSQLVFIGPTVNPRDGRFSTEANALLHDIPMEWIRCNLIISTDYPVRTS